MQTITVSQLMGPHLEYALNIHPDTSLEEVIERFVANNALRVIFLVDEQKGLVGVVNRRDLLNWARLRLDIPLSVHPTSLATVRRLVLATRVRDVMMPESERLRVHAGDTLDRAIDMMLQSDLLDLPVVVADARVIGAIRLSDILSYAIHATSAASGGF
jgi:CBS domain-containing protein